ncbi:type I-E CRISPR-associated protein Cas7/Cse4/CasC [Arthrobacter woluwensis]|uniref:type I-E CRISPR-associated protein Cas7/Cse4/CasC n=1 Tax=Arthrobacter woluwensis TaxID=156980 RepID=UPI000D12C462|nr:type I-E CRISPR-associated protein Cas7/Cse4/CasC [Arthrobacter woluwensis]PSS43029.1 type I-E CRISPR-associated protein Cas7/Cse4/CasC [Arthrobacter woluwensis]
MTKYYLDIHALQTVPPSNVNRDDTGSPKTAVYGGARRARVSSQAWKRAIRKDFKDYLDASELGIRTKRLVELVAGHVRELSPDLADRAGELAVSALEAGGFKVEVSKSKGTEDAKPPQTGYLLFVSNVQARKLAELAVAADREGAKLEKKAVKEALNTDHSVDVALFGRMIADSTDLNVDASTQVAHAISVHAVETEFDYFTAVDDENAADESGAGMIGTVEFNSSTLYRYATVNLQGLVANLGDKDASVKAAASFVRSFIESMPTGKQNTFANRTLPDAVVVTLRERTPLNLVGAFEEAVDGESGKGRLKGAAERLARYAVDMEQGYGPGAVKTFVVAPTSAVEPLRALGDPVTLDGLIKALEAELPERIQVA